MPIYIVKLLIPGYNKFVLSPYFPPAKYSQVFIFRVNKYDRAYPYHLRRFVVTLNYPCPENNTHSVTLVRGRYYLGFIFYPDVKYSTYHQNSYKSRFINTNCPTYNMWLVISTIIIFGFMHERNTKAKWFSNHEYPNTWHGFQMSLLIYQLFDRLQIGNSLHYHTVFL